MFWAWGLVTSKLATLGVFQKIIIHWGSCSVQMVVGLLAVDSKGLDNTGAAPVTDSVPLSGVWNAFLLQIPP